MRTRSLSLFFVFFLTWEALAAVPRFVFDPKDSHIGGVVKYSLIGEYTCAFEKYDGSMDFDPDQLDQSSVHLEIDVDSIKSAFSQLDKIVRSPRLLDSARYPKVIFQSETIKKSVGVNEYIVHGKLAMHGVEREVDFTFTAIEVTREDGRRSIQASGQWTINRKDFGIYWHPYLDKAGLLVGNYLRVDWSITAVARP